TVDRIKALLPELRASIPPSVSLIPTFDRTTTIRASVKDIEFTLLLTVALVVMVIFLFLRNAWATIIPSIALPLSIIGAFGVMYLLNYSLDNLSLMALAICTGFVVDDAIVVIENITRYLEAGDTPLDAALKGSREIGSTVVSMSTSLIAVFIPILLMGGIVGRLFREFAVTLSIAIMVSLVVSLTTTPMLSAKYLEPHGRRGHGWFYRSGERALAWLAAGDELGLRWVLKHQGVVLVITVLTFVLNVYLYILVPKGFFPEQDAGRIGGQVQGQQDVSFAQMKKKVLALAEIVGQDPGVQDVTAFAGGRGNTNAGFMFMSLKPDAERHKTGDTAQVIVDRLRPKVSNMPGAIA